MTVWAAGLSLGPYELLAPLGSGGMGEVWRARDTRLHRQVAVKRLKDGRGDIQHEARAIAALNHPHICQIYDTGPDYLVMELIDGAPFQGPLPVARAVELAIQVALALEYAHGRGILHRDLKPANILISDGGAKLLDFGIAKATADTDATLTLEGVRKGTLPYMSPEQAEGRPLDARSEVFSFGAVLYEVLAGRQAFGSLAAVLRDQPLPLAAPVSVAAVIERCLRKVPEHRFGSMQDLRTALEQALAAPREVRITASSEARASIAVLPFANMSADPEQEYFSDGLTEEIINELAQVDGLKVIARTSAFAFKGQNSDIRQIAAALGVANILEGSVRKAANRVRITAQLIAARDGAHLWSERYDRDLHDIFAVQDEIAAAIARELCGKLLLPLFVRHQHYQPLMAAYEAYWKGAHHVVRIDPENMGRAKACFEQAIALDPKFALPHTGLTSFYMIASMSGVMRARDAMPQARQAISRALELEPDLPEGHAQAGAIAAMFDFDWVAAAKHFAQARSRTPVLPYVRFLYAVRYLHPLGRISEALMELDGILEEDPLNLPVRLNRVASLWEAGRDEEASREVEEMAERHPNPSTLAVRMADLTFRKEFERASAVADQWFRMTPGAGLPQAVMAAVARRRGETARAAEMIADVEQGDAPGRSLGLASYHLVSGDIQQVARWVEEAIVEREPTLMTWLSLPSARALRASEYWPPLRAKMNLPEVVR